MSDVAQIAQPGRANSGRRLPANRMLYVPRIANRTDRLALSWKEPFEEWRAKTFPDGFDARLVTLADGRFALRLYPPKGKLPTVRARNENTFGWERLYNSEFPKPTSIPEFGSVLGLEVKGDRQRADIPLPDELPPLSPLAPGRAEYLAKRKANKKARGGAKGKAGAKEAAEAQQATEPPAEALVEPPAAEPVAQAETAEAATAPVVAEPGERSAERRHPWLDLPAPPGNVTISEAIRAVNWHKERLGETMALSVVEGYLRAFVEYG